MRLKYILLFIVTYFSISIMNAQIRKYPPKVVIIGIGEKNPTFDESKFPHLTFYYTPELVPEKEHSESVNAIVQMTDGTRLAYKGSPEFLKNLWNNVKIDKGFMLFDKEARCYALGYRILSQRNDIGARMCTDKKGLGKHIKDVVKKGKTVKKNKKEITFSSSRKFNKTMIGNKLPDFNIVNTVGETVSFNTVLNEKPTLVVFFNLPKNIDVAAAKTKKKVSFKSMFSAASSGGIETLFDNLESQFFNYDVRKH